MSIIRDEGGIKKLYLSASGLADWYSCQRSFFYRKVLGYRREGYQSAANFGSALHAALAAYYRSSKPKEFLPEQLTLVEDLVAGTIPAGTPANAQGDALKALGEYMISNPDPLTGPVLKGYRSVEHGVAILTDYFEQFRDDGWLPIRGSDGNLMVEQGFEMPVGLVDEIPNDPYLVVLNGYIDLVVQTPGGIFVVDHKSSTSISAQFFSRMKPNHQFTGYIMAVREVFGLPTNALIVNAMQVVQKKVNNVRVGPTMRSEWDFEDFRETWMIAGRQIVRAIRDNEFSMNAPNACTSWGGCPFRSVCNTSRDLREKVLDAEFVIEHNEKAKGDAGEQIE